MTDSDSHEDIISKFCLHADGARGPNIVRVELSPGKELKRFDDYGKWHFRIDQDVMPDWAPRCDAGSMKDLEKRTRDSLIRRVKEGFGVVDTRGCAALTSLEAPKAQTVDASGCAALTSLEAPEATYVDANGCAALTSLEAPKAKYVDARGCAALRIPDGFRGRVIR